MRYLQFIPSNFSRIRKTLARSIQNPSLPASSPIKSQSLSPRNGLQLLRDYNTASVAPERVMMIVDQISDLTLLEVAGLMEVLREKFGVGVTTNGMGFGGLKGAAKGEEKAAEEKTAFDLKLKEFDATQKMKVMMEVRTLTDLGLKEAKELVEKAPTLLKKEVTKEEGEAIIAKMKKVGAKVTMEYIKRFDICSPGIITPDPWFQRPAACVRSVPHRKFEPVLLRPGMVLLRNFLCHEEQVDIVRTCRTLGVGHGGFHQSVCKDGGKIGPQMMHLGLNSIYEIINRRKLPCIPLAFERKGRLALSSAQEFMKVDFNAGATYEDILPSFLIQACVVSFYSVSLLPKRRRSFCSSQQFHVPTGSLCGASSIVSLHVGDSAEFLFRNLRYVNDRLTGDVNKLKISLDSGDALIYGAATQGSDHAIAHQIHLLRPQSGSHGDRVFRELLSSVGDWEWKPTISLAGLQFQGHVKGRPEDQTQITATHLRNAGFHTWEKLILK
ncbi:hypothetical protein FNV43_RR06695 [Rhamnella rubrinervis]|uniref:Ribosomal protein L7/L12 C-terminal domain-containing protein n=1 Tax=Rhamnella rubrinervis TaxID=2594499 RepID=A0A8K0MLI4_9ROSA|nr:hypothetical protein FNV43_RR06695 [Rhamnella rubrinervis]